jgi:hypothetical protein
LVLGYGEDAIKLLPDNKEITIQVLEDEPVYMKASIHNKEAPGKLTLIYQSIPDLKVYVSKTQPKPTYHDCPHDNRNVRFPS